MNEILVYFYCFGWCLNFVGVSRLSHSYLWGFRLPLVDIRNGRLFRLQAMDHIRIPKVCKDFKFEKPNYLSPKYVYNNSNHCLNPQN